MEATLSRETHATWRRMPEPVGRLETADEYTALAENSFRASDSAFAREIAGKIPREFREPVLDLGCGPGNIAIPLSHFRPDLTIICYDFSPQMLEIARQRSLREGISTTRMIFQQGDMRELYNKVDGMKNGYIYSNTALHELRTQYDLELTFSGISTVIGQYGGCFIRDLTLPRDAQEAEDWRREFLGDGTLQDRELELVVNSQHAAFPLKAIRRAINKTDLRGRGILFHPPPPKSRYWIYEIQPSAS